MSLPDKVTLLPKDCTKLTDEDIQDSSVDLIITDPLYGEEYLYLLDGLAQLACKKLKPGGSLVFSYGQYHMDKLLVEVFSKYRPQLNYVWMSAANTSLQI
jgi:hypothetical protein